MKRRENLFQGKEAVVLGYIEPSCYLPMTDEVSQLRKKTNLILKLQITTPV